MPPQRHLFELPDDVTYLNCAYMSPQLRSVREAGAEALGAQLVGADADGVALVPSVSYGLGVAAANVPVRVGQRLVVWDFVPPAPMRWPLVYS